jgi:hypothetical protein
MSVIPLGDEATISDVTGKLNKREEYVRHVLANMYDCKRQFGSASVRIGVMGEGRAPNYPLEYPKEGLSSPAVFRVYNGLSHTEMEGLGHWNLSLAELVGSLDGKPLPKSPEHHVQSEHWSKCAMTLDEVAALLGQLRARRR